MSYEAQANSLKYGDQTSTQLKSNKSRIGSFLSSLFPSRKSKEVDTKQEFEKVLFRYHSNVLDKSTVETMWAEKVDQENGIYKLSNIPFYGPPYCH